jgi:hypothetical protein
MKHRADIDGPEQRTADNIERSQEQYERDIDDEDIADMLEDTDPTPYCSGCGAMQKSRCHCGPIAENE